MDCCKLYQLLAAHGEVDEDCGSGCLLTAMPPVNEENREKSLMMSLLFLLFLLVMVLTLTDREKLSYITYGAAMVLSIFWLIHHSTSTLNIQL